MTSIHNDFGLTPQDVVLTTLPRSDKRRRDLLNACKTTGAHLITSSQEIAAQTLAKTILLKGVTVTATTPELWQEIYREVNNARRDNLGRIRALVFNGKREPETRDHLMWHTQPA